MGLMNRVFTVQEFSAGVGVVEVAIALLIALRPWSRKGSAIGSPALVQLFLKTLSFLFRRLVGRSFHADFRRSPLGQASFC
jgi:reactive chlorine resistance protein C